MKLQDIPNRVHFVGIGGVGTSALAQWLLQKGYTVSGSDVVSNAYTQKLQKMGAKIYTNHSKDNAKDAQLVVHTSAVPATNQEIAFAKQHGVPVVLREQLLGAIFNSYPKRIAVCGTHGKTTVTAMIHKVLCDCNILHTCFVGGSYLGNNFWSNGCDVVLAEACEYNCSFKHLKPHYCVCLNAELDHLDCFASQQEVHAAFASFLKNTSQSGAIVVPNGLQKLSSHANTIVVGKDVYAANVTNVDGKYRFDMVDQTGTYPVQLSIVGKHNVANALHCFAIAKTLGLPLDKVSQSIGNFEGVERRWTQKRTTCTIICDYAHHPTEIRCAVKSAQDIAKGRIICAFQPHTYTRTQHFFKQFVQCFCGVDKLVYLPIFSARESPIAFVDSKNLTKLAQTAGLDCSYCQNFEQAKQLLQNIAQPNDIILVLGAGNIVELYNML